MKRDEGDRQASLQLVEERIPHLHDDVGKPAYTLKKRSGVWVVTGKYFLHVLDRYKEEETSLGSKIANTQSDSLGELLKTDDMSQEEQLAIAVEFESCFGVIEKDGTWRIKKSTNPKLEGKPLFGEGCLLRERTGTIRHILPNGGERVWKLCDTNTDICFYF